MFFTKNFTLFRKFNNWDWWLIKYWPQNKIVSKAHEPLRRKRTSIREFCLFAANGGEFTQRDLAPGGIFQSAAYWFTECSGNRQ
jgi:hypothetical protein